MISQGGRQFFESSQVPAKITKVYIYKRGTFGINLLNASEPSYRNQSIDSLCKSIDCFLYEDNTGI